MIIIATSYAELNPSNGVDLTTLELAFCIAHVFNSPLEVAFSFNSEDDPN